MQAPNPGTEKLLLTMATYNEGENVGKLIPQLLELVPHAHVLIIDDNSPDGTGRVVDRMRQGDPRIHIIHRPAKMGLGTALLAAMRFAMEHDYDLMLNLDADFSHPVRYLPNLLAGMAKKDVMIGSRYVEGGDTENWPLSRRAISQSVNLLVRFMFRMGVKDASGGYRCYRVSKLRETNLEALLSKGYSFQQEVLYRCFLAGARLGETPILFENRKFGKSKVSLKEATRSLSMLVYLGFRKWTKIDRRRKS